MKKQQKYRLQKDLTLLSASLFIIVAVWVSFTIYHSYVTSTISEALQFRIEPITGQFDTATINKLKSRNAVEPEYANALGTTSAKVTPLPATPEAIVPEETQADSESVSSNEAENTISISPEQVEEIGEVAP